ncbi:MAG: SDR family oxidoreductase [Alphaproteobacteria bacterium]|nr:SDR family oxidoreductase [Alphaproteobacteria bacterium]
MKLFSLTLAAALIAGSAFAKDTVVVAGATSKSGRAIVEQLAAAGYTVRALSRNPEKSKDFPAGVEVVMADVTKPETLPAAMKGAQVLLSTVGAVPFGTDVPEKIDFHGVAAMTDAAKAAGVKQIVHMTSLGSGSSDPNEQLNKMFNMILMWKGKGEDHIRNSGLAWTIVRPGGLADCEAGKAGLLVGHMDGSASGRVCRADGAAVMVAAIGNADYNGKTISVIQDDKAAVNAWKGQIKAIPRD